MNPAGKVPTRQTNGEPTLRSRDAVIHTRRRELPQRFVDPGPLYD